MIFLGFCLACWGTCFDQVAAEDAAGIKALDGLWSGAWGGGERDGVVFQPVVAELLIKGDHVELAGFPNARRLAGTVRFDASAKRMQITPANTRGEAAKGVTFSYELEGNELKLVDDEKLAISLERRPTAENPPANADVEFVAVSGINEAGDLLVTEYRTLRTGKAGIIVYEPVGRSLKTKQATVLLVQENGLKKISLAEARRLVRDPTLVAISYREEESSPDHLYELWKDAGSPAPDSEAVGRTFARMLRPGTLIFILSARENVPAP
jgi:hypothetical protein